MRGIPMSHRVKKRNGLGWRQASHCLFALEVNFSLGIKHPVSGGRDCEPLTRSEATEGLRKSMRSVLFLCFYVHVFICLYAQTSNTSPHPMIPFPCWESLYDRFPQFLPRKGWYTFYSHWKGDPFCRPQIRMLTPPSLVFSIATSATTTTPPTWESAPCPREVCG